SYQVGLGEGACDLFVTRRRPAEDLFPHWRGLHTHIQRHLGRSLFEPAGERAVHLDTQSLERAPLAVGAGHLFAGEQAGVGKPPAYGRAQGWREAQAAKADPGHAARVDGRENARYRVLVAVFPAWILDQRIEVKTEFIASRLHTPCRRQSSGE